MPEAKTPRAAKKGSIQHHKKRGTLAKKSLNLPKEPVVSSKQIKPETLAYYMYDEDSKLGWELDDDGTWNMWSYFRGEYIDYGMTPYDYGWTGPEEGDATTMQKKPSTLAYYEYDSTYDMYWMMDDNGNWSYWENYKGWKYTEGWTPYDYGWTDSEEGDAAASTDYYGDYYGDEAAAASTDSYYYYYGDEAATGYDYYDYDYYYSYDGAATMAASVTMLFAAVHLM